MIWFISDIKLWTLEYLHLRLELWLDTNDIYIWLVACVSWCETNSRTQAKLTWLPRLCMKLTQSYMWYLYINSNQPFILNVRIRSIHMVCDSCKCKYGKEKFVISRPLAFDIPVSAGPLRHRIMFCYASPGRPLVSFKDDTLSPQSSLLCVS